VDKRQRMNQLADMLVDHCRCDIEGITKARGKMAADLAARTVIDAVVFTCKADPEAWGLLKSLVEGGDR